MSQHTSQPKSAKVPIGVRPRRDFDALQRRRERAAVLFDDGFKPAQVAEQLGVSVQAASVWQRRWQQAGASGMAGAGRAGRRPRLDAQALEAVEQALLEGAEAHGYRNQLWTLSRVAEVIRQTTGVSYHPGHVWRILQQLGWSRQKPSRWAMERDPEKVEAWVKNDWPEIKRGPSKQVRGSSSRTRAGSR